jgi:hypothetical protein
MIERMNITIKITKMMIKANETHFFLDEEVAK